MYDLVCQVPNCNHLYKPFMANRRVITDFLFPQTLLFTNVMAQCLVT
jgi:hypothetical protein